jgi:hypothetical protein
MQKNISQPPTSFSFGLRGEIAPKFGLGNAFNCPTVGMVRCRATDVEEIGFKVVSRPQSGQISDAVGICSPHRAQNNRSPQEYSKENLAQTSK